MFYLLSYNIITVFLFVFKNLFLLHTLYFVFYLIRIVPQFTIIMYCLHVHVSMRIRVYTYGIYCPMYNEIICYQTVKTAYFSNTTNIMYLYP